MTNHTANYIGFSSSLQDNARKTGNKGVWSLKEQFFNICRNTWLGNYIFGRGGNETFVSGTDGYRYKIHTFNSPGTFTVDSITGDVDVYFEITGGGGSGGSSVPGGSSSGGGGGAGGAFFGKYTHTTPSPISITIGGAGGASNLISDGITRVTCNGGGNGGNGTYQGNNFPAGGSGGSVTVHPTVTTFISTSIGGNPGGPWPGRPAAGEQMGGNAYDGLAAYPALPNAGLRIGLNTSTNILFPSPPLITSRGSGGGGSPGGSGGGGGVGIGGTVRLFYRLDNLNPQNN